MKAISIAIVIAAFIISASILFTQDRLDHSTSDNDPSLYSPLEQSAFLDRLKEELLSPENQRKIKCAILTEQSMKFVDSSKILGARFSNDQESIRVEFAQHFDGDDFFDQLVGYAEIPDDPAVVAEYFGDANSKLEGVNTAWSLNLELNAYGEYVSDSPLCDYDIVIDRRASKEQAAAPNP